MVSLTQRQELAALAGADERLKNLARLLNGEALSDSAKNGRGVREEILSAISSNDGARFKQIAAEIGGRKISPDSDWCHDDYLLFLLLLGNEKFGRSLSFLPAVIEARRKNPNPVPQKINEVFAALERGEFGIDGEFGFLKIPFLHLVGKLRVGPAEARKTIQALNQPGLTDSMSPFLKLLTHKAYDLVLIERQPLATETAVQVIEGIEAHAKNFSIRQWWRVVTALPGRIILTVIMAILGLGLIPLLIGLGKGLVESHAPQISRTRPTGVSVLGAAEPTSDLPPEILLLSKVLGQTNAATGKKPLLLEVDAMPFSSATPSFVVEVSHPEKPIKNAIAFTQAIKTGVRPFTMVPVQREGGRIRAILPEQPAGQSLCFILEFDGDSVDTAQTVGKKIMIRPLQ